MHGLNMQRVNNIYNNIIDIKTIKDMYDKRIRLNTKNKAKINKFDYNYVSNISYIKQLLESKNYHQGKYNLFIITKPKVRLIMSQNIIDKIINHLVSQYFLVDIFDKSLINMNVATRLNKGTHYALNRLIAYLKHNINKELYVLKFDISKYFYNIDHDILKNIMSTKIKDKDVLNILDMIIDSTDKSYVNINLYKLKHQLIFKTTDKKIIQDIKDIPYYKQGKGLAIGNMTSQALAIIYLNYLDHYIKEKLKIKMYIRYMDDGILISSNKDYLKYCLKEIEKIITDYKLELNKNKTMICSLTHGFEFLGFRFIKQNNKLIIKVKNQTKKRFKTKIKTLSNLYLNNKIKWDKLYQVKVSYDGHLSYGNTNSLINNINNKYHKAFLKLEKDIKKKKYHYKKRNRNININDIVDEIRIINKKIVYVKKNQ